MLHYSRTFNTKGKGTERQQRWQPRGTDTVRMRCGVGRTDTAREKSAALPRGGPFLRGVERSGMKRNPQPRGPGFVGGLDSRSGRPSTTADHEHSTRTTFCLRRLSLTSRLGRRSTAPADSIPHYSSRRRRRTEYDQPYYEQSVCQTADAPNIGSPLSWRELRMFLWCDQPPFVTQAKRGAASGCSNVTLGAADQTSSS